MTAIIDGGEREGYWPPSNILDIGHMANESDVEEG